MVSKLWYLKKFNLFSDLEHEEVQELAEKTEMESFEPENTIYFPGATAKSIFILKEGQVRLSRRTPEGKKITVAILEPGEIFGELALSGDEDYTTEAETMESSLICSVSTEQFKDFLSRYPELNFEVTKFLGERRREIESKIENLIFRDAAGRLAYVLEDLFENHAREPEEGSDPSINFSHKELAELSGLTRPTTTRLLNELADEDVIDLERRRIILRDGLGLKRQLTPG